jgi:hypothetical protein
VTVPLAVGFGALYTLLAVENLATQLYPDIAGARSAHYAAAARRSNLIAGVLATAVVVALTLTLVDETANKAWVLLLYGFCLSALAWGPDAESPSGAETDQVSALRNLLTDHGLRLADVPRSDDVALDPYLSDIDLIATHGDIDYVVSLARGNEGPKGVRWTEAANLKLGAFAVTKMAADESQRFRHVLPLLVVTASLNDERLVAYCSAEQISLVQVSADGVRMHVARDADAWLHDVDWQSLQPPRRTKEASS